MNHHPSDAISREYIKSLLEARSASYDLQTSKKDKMAIAIEISLLETILNAHQPEVDYSVLQRSWMSNHY